MPVWLRRSLWFVAAMALVFAMGFYRQSIQTGEGVGFSINYPAAGNQVGGMGARGEEGKVIVDAGSPGLVKMLLQPNVVELSSHFVRNVGDRPYRIRIAAEDFKYPVRLESNEKTWNEADHSIGRALPAGSMVTAEVFVTLPRPLPSEKQLDKGNVVIYDADTGARLTVLPVRIINGRAGAVPGGD